ncbi:MAG: SUMF1/EgtB/PvdO family nonheme iron enzyme [Thermoguttaceae bacterium]|nr:SUMF1/EgtB/PvdO family nonheme iron enzyme [Thermoguttaceae bacterium]
MGLIRGASKGVMAFLMTHDDAYKLHRVTLTRGFWMLETPTTQRMYTTIVCANPSASALNRNNGDTSEFPVENVNWDDCQNFLRHMNSFGVQPPGMRFRLPTEAEWEYACRAGTLGDFSFACAPNDGMWHMGNSDDMVKRVGLKAPNPWGLVDMHGNVKEWCADWLADYPEGAAIDPIGPTCGKKRVVRGGSYGEFAAACSSWDRTYAYKPTKRANDIGFRFVLAPLN